MRKNSVVLDTGPVKIPKDFYSVLVTRPIHQQVELVEMLNRHGVATLSKPLFAIEGLSLPEDIDRLKPKIQNFAEYDIAIFISTNAARFGAEWIDKYWPQFPHNLQAIAIGPSTAQAVTDTLACPVIQSNTGTTSEDILALDELKQVSSKRIAIFRGIGGRELLADVLKERGAAVDYFEVYTRTSIHYDQSVLAEEIEAKGVNIFSANSSETVAMLKAELGRNFCRLSGTQLLVPSSRVAQEAEEHGFTNVVSCNGAGPGAFVAALHRIADTT